MTFSYDVTTDIGKIRLEIGDTTENSGVRANGDNFSNEELTVWYDREGSVLGAVAAACEALSRDWARLADLDVGERSEKLGAIAEKWAARAASLRAQIGGGAIAAFSYAAQRADGYADSSSEYTP